MSELVKQTELQEIAIKTNSILTENTGRVQRALKAGEILLQAIEQNGMNDDIDEQCNTYLVASRKTLAHISEQRKPVTQLFDNIKKLFTEQEAELDPKKGTYYPKIQAYRDAWAAHKYELQRKAEEEARRKLAVDKEKAELATKVSTDFYQWLEDYLTKHLQGMSNILNSATLETIKEVETKIYTYKAIFETEWANAFNPQIRVAYISAEESKQIIEESKKDVLMKFREVFSQRTRDHKDDVLRQLPSKERELKAIAEAEANDKKQAELLKAEQKKREQDEADRLKREAAEREQKQKDDAKLKEEESKMNSLFDAQAQISGSDEPKNVRKSLEIVIKHPKAYTQIFMFWFEKEGINLPIDKLERYTLQRMQSFCESWATKEGETIESPYVEYREAIKTIAKS